jgi:hypothetical protein
LHSINNDEDSIHPHLNKKEKRILKHELFIERMWRLLFPQRLSPYIFFPPLFFFLASCRFRSSSNTSRLTGYYPAASIIVSGLEASRAPYSKSHARRLKRNERERLAGGGMESLKIALPSISKSAEDDDDTTANAKTTAAASTESVPDNSTEAPSSPARLGQIGQGKGAPLTRSQRRRALCVILFLPLKTRPSLVLLLLCWLF